MPIKPRKTATAFGLAFLLAASPTMGIAATRTAPAPVNPLAMVSAFASPAAASALCGNATATAAAGAAAATQAPGGCVLPVVDPAPAPVVESPPPPPPRGGIGIWPVLLGLLGIAGLALLISDDDDDGDDVPVSAT